MLDSGIDKNHPHFAKHKNLDLPAPLVAESFIPGCSATEGAFGHGTHVAGIIAGEATGDVMAALETAADADQTIGFALRSVAGIRGMAPECKLLSLRVLKDSGDGDVTAVINALERVLQLNAYGEHICIHGVNISAGYLRDVRWYATGQTPICSQVDRVVRSGVCVVAAAGNTGFIATRTIAEDVAHQFTEGDSYAAQFATINDPGNAQLAITVGSTHREKPHTFGVSYFSSRGPTADGRPKPDVLAPGERIISRAAGANVQRVVGVNGGTVAAGSFGYVEDTGTSMAAPHVSGIAAGFLSVRREFAGRTEELREMIIASATDLKRDTRMQGAGLVDSMRLFTSSWEADMITQYGGFPAFDIMYDEGGRVVDSAMESEAAEYFTTGAGSEITDVFLFSHGWNNDEAEARANVYAPFLETFRTVLPQAARLAQRSFGVIALFWPSKRFAEADLIPGGAASVGTAADARVAAQLDRLGDVFISDPTAVQKIAHALTLVPNLELSPAAQDDFVSTLVSLPPQPRFEVDEGLDDAVSALQSTPGREVLQRLSRPFIPAVPFKPGSGGAAAFSSSASTATPALAPGTGSAAGWIGDLAGGIKNAACDLGNVLTYYTMKDRAGIVGRTGAVQTLRLLLTAKPADEGRRYHVVGHSFGGRLVTSAVNALAGGAESVETMTLLEAAYSHNGLAHDWDGANRDGSFRSVVAPVQQVQRVLITHAAHDMPVGVAYPLASRAMNQAADAVFGGPNDKFGGMGRNGAQHTPEAFDDELRDIDAARNPYVELPEGKFIRNLNGDGPLPKPTINGHGDVTKPEIVWAFAMHL